MTSKLYISTVRSLLEGNFYKHNKTELDLDHAFLYLKTRHLEQICTKWNDDYVDIDNDDTPEWIAILIKLMKTQCDESTQEAWSWSVKDANDKQRGCCILIYKLAILDQGLKK